MTRVRFPANAQDPPFAKVQGRQWPCPPARGLSACPETALRRGGPNDHTMEGGSRPFERVASRRRRARARRLTGKWRPAAGEATEGTGQRAPSRAGRGRAGPGGTGRRRSIAWAPNASRVLPGGRAGGRLGRAAGSQLGRLAEILAARERRAPSESGRRSLVV